MGKKDVSQTIDVETYVEQIDEEKAKKFYERSYAEAEDILKDEDKMERFLQKIREEIEIGPYCWKCAGICSFNDVSFKKLCKKRVYQPSSSNYDFDSCSTHILSVSC